MVGNFVLVLFVWLFTKHGNTNKNLVIGMAVGCVSKFIFMWFTVSFLILALLGPGSGLPAPALAAAKFTFSVTQLITAVIGCLTVLPLKNTMDKVMDK